MSAQSIQPAFTTFQDLDGQPLENGMIYIGTDGLAAETNQITVYWDSALTTPATQPIRTTGGYPMNSGTPGKIYIGVEDYSIAVNNKNNSTVTSALNAYSSFNSSSISYTPALTGSPTLTGALTKTLAANLNHKSVNVWDFIPEGTDTTAVDCSPYFNLATQATLARTTDEIWDGTIAYEIIVPNGRYRIDNPVYVRKSQSLTGGGKNVVLDFTNCIDADMIVMGVGLIDGVETIDGSGLPCTVHNFFTLGGPASNAVVTGENVAGYTISNMFLTSAAIGIKVGGGDGVISNIQIDIAAIGLSITASNAVISNFNLYQCNYAISIDGNGNDVSFSNGQIEYTLYAGVIFNNSDVSGVVENQGFNFTNVNFVQNAAYTGTWAGCVYALTDVKARFNHCQFSNYHSFAINHGAGTAYLDFSDCLFSGIRTNPTYTQNTSAAGISTATNGYYNFNSCNFRNMYGPCYYVAGEIGYLQIEGGSIEGGTVDRITIDAGVTTVPNITLKDVAGLAFTNNDTTDQWIVLPYWLGSTSWEVSVRANTNVSGSGYFSRFEKSIFTLTYCYDGAAALMDMTKDIVSKSGTQSSPGDLALSNCVGTTPGGAAFGIGTPQSGYMCISFAAVDTNTNHVKWNVSLVS